MSEDKEKTGFWGLFRGGTLSRRLTKSDKDRPRRSNTADHDAHPRKHRRRSSPPPEAGPSSRRRPRRAEPESAKGKGLDTPNGNGNGNDNGRSFYSATPLTEWPPSGVNSDEELTLGHAMELISRGVPAHRGHKRPIPHASDHHYALFATTAGPGGDPAGEEEEEAAMTDGADAHDAMIQLMTLRLGGGKGKAEHPWETLEQPSYAFWFGRRPGTVTLNRWAAMGSTVPPSLALRNSGVAPRELDLPQIFQRLKELERGLEDDDEDLMYRNLYRRLLKDPDKFLRPHRTLDKQITDLILVLSRPDYWIDFTEPRNQVVTRFFFDTRAGGPEEETYRRFFHQLLLTLELDLRIHSRRHDGWAKDKLLAALPPTIRWGLALSRRWRDYVRVEAWGDRPDQVRLRLKLRKRQARMLKRFAQLMKWPNLAAVVSVLKQHHHQHHHHRGDVDNDDDDDDDVASTTVSSHALAFFSGLVLPGPTFPFLVMNTLVDVDPDRRATDPLALLTHLHPQCGFQYRGGHTYWSSASIVGKVLAPTCRELAGWVGPARPTADLARSQIARVRCRRARSGRAPPSAEDVLSMAERSDPLGPPAEVYPAGEYGLVAAGEGDGDGDAADTVRIEKLSLKPAAAATAAATAAGGSGSAQAVADTGGPGWYDASVQFAIGGASWPLRLAFDVAFVCAWPCAGGPHALFFDYAYVAVRADEVVGVREWAAPATGASSSSAGASSEKLNGGSSMGGRPAAAVVSKGGDDEKVLVIEASGVPDNEVLARAWCAHWGLSAVVADVGRTCAACAIREAYAATLTVVILVEDRGEEVDA